MLAAVKAAYDDNASYEEDASTSKAAAFITAARILLRRLPQRTNAGGGTELELDLGLIRAELKAAQQWYQARAGTGGGVKHADLRNYRN